MSKCSALTHKNNEILVHILPFKSAYYLILIPNSLIRSIFYKKNLLESCIQADFSEFMLRWPFVILVGR
jgi:hypothetical protein